MGRLTIPDVRVDEHTTRRSVIDVAAVREHAMEFYCQLKAYEDTGLTPEEITKIGMETEAGCVRAIARMYGVDTNRLRELTAADRDGRVLILPCKLGTKVYRIRYTIADYPDEPDLEIADTWFTPEYREDIGKTVFLTREEAERAMQEMEGKKDGKT